MAEGEKTVGEARGEADAQLTLASGEAQVLAEGLCEAFAELEKDGLDDGEVESVGDAEGDREPADTVGALSDGVTDGAM